MVLRSRVAEGEKQQPKSEALFGNLADLQLLLWRTVRFVRVRHKLEEIFVFVCVCMCVLA